MKNKIYPAILIFPVLFLALAPVSAGVVPGLEFQAGLELEDLHYRESHFMREDGWQYGLYGSLRLVRTSPFILDLEISWVGGTWSMTARIRLANR